MFAMMVRGFAIGVGAGTGYWLCALAGQYVAVRRFRSFAKKAAAGMRDLGMIPPPTHPALQRDRPVA